MATLPVHIDPDAAALNDPDYIHTLVMIPMLVKQSAAA
ncbi:MAG: hypothetical protein QOF01_202 [Thermomicrobiales bacterium]|jgi:hypothetical protein|nr:hypothetical protein [Thermomicrobiales bacterium]